MSQESYLAGFCKTAEAHGVDPAALAEYAVKTAQDGTGVLAQALDWIKNKANQFEGMHPSTRALIGAGVGGAAGGGLGAAIKGKKGVGTGAAIGALVGGGAGAVPWKDLAAYLGSIGEEKRKSDLAEGLVDMGADPEQFSELKGLAQRSSTKSKGRVENVKLPGILGKIQELSKKGKKLEKKVRDAAANDDVETLSQIPGALDLYNNGGI